MGKKIKEFRLGEVPPEKIYNMLVNLLRSAPINQYLRYRLRMKLISHSILSDEPFSAVIKAETLLRFLENTQDITCKIFSQGGETILTIESAISVKPAILDGQLHLKNINRLYSELKFRLDSVGKPKLKDTLQSNEKIIEYFFPIEYQGNEFFSILTNYRILLCRNQIIFTEITPQKINSVTLVKEWTNEYITAFYVGGVILACFGILSLIYLILGGFFSMMALYFSLPITIFGGVLPIIVGIIISFKKYLLIEETGTSLKLYASRKSLSKLNKWLQYLCSSYRKN